jgi:uncharacterized membrane protein
MTADNDPNSEPTLFSATLTPHRSLSRKGFIVLMAAVSLISFVAGMAFLIAGAWPVFGFFGLDVLLIYWAFRANYRAAAEYEQVMVTPSELKFRKVSAKGRIREWTLNPLWVRLERETHEEFGVQRLFLTFRGRQLSIGQFLSPDEKDSFSTALTAALAEARRGPTRTVLA